MNVEGRDICFSYDQSHPVLENVSFRVDDGRIMAVLGPNGAGKTTLLKCVLGLLKPDSGDVLIDGVPRFSMHGSAFWRLCAYVPQARTLTFSYSVEEMVLLGRGPYLHFFEMPTDHDRAIAEKAMAAAGVLDLRERSCDEISGGERQLVLIARALAAEPKILVLDEPETGLDLANQLRIMNLLDTLSHQKGLTILLNTHSADHAFAIADDTLLLTHTRPIFGRTEEVLNEETMQEAFGVRVHLHKETIDGKEYVSMVPVSLAEKKPDQSGSRKE
ncbi:MAG TPA: ABC transporter [Erysipelotrichaceae bacterium]|jgi:iron complex transport system ATP-binding protein|nr:ABC transporter [Erysipelotrichaceae bacterium]